MRKVAMVLFVVLVTVSFVFAESQPIEYADEWLEKAIREVIGIPEGLIYPEDVIDVARLTASNLQSATLKGIEHCENLIYFWSGAGRVSDVSALNGLVRLRYLNLHSNKITDISALSGLVNLEELDLDGNSIKDLSPLANLKNLKTLKISKNSIRLSNVSALLELPKLSSLDVSGSLIDDQETLDKLEERGVIVRR